MTTTYLGLGSSLGDRAAHLAFAVRRLGETSGIAVRRVSQTIETAPEGGVATHGFLNAAVEIETTLSPRDLLAACLAIEAEAGRDRAVRWADRTLDIDILLYGDSVIDDGDLRIPHPRLVERAFALAPLGELAADRVVAGTGFTVRELLERIGAAAR
ncbi:MAG: 2-amino-4-hydroxy-6-hydroxymethyldihydropteridine diphosphokinase [Deltaproteobacteria bacterium]|nr:2-amino-4-hydroxy-6-hydroxymethyldihydropteridine diphosphokinase [Deltaproteobacteria bacterium]